MPLPEASHRKHVHTRTIDCRGYEREDGLWDIEAHMIDTKNYQFRNNWRGEMQIGEPLHEMLLRVTIDDDFLIRDVIAVTDNAPFKMCPDISPAYKALIGVKMGPGWRKAIRMKVGGIQGCTHLTELLFPWLPLPCKLFGRCETSVREKRMNQNRNPHADPSF